MKYGSRGRSILLGSSKACASAGPSITTEARRATASATSGSRKCDTDAGTTAEVLSGFPAQKIRDQPQSGRLALLGMELGAGKVVAAHDSGDRSAIVGQRQHGVRLARLELEGVHEIGVLAGRDAFEQRVR